MRYSIDAVLQTLSEATRLLPDAKKSLCPDIFWREIGGFRNILVHDYPGNIDLLTVKTVIEQYLDPLEACVRTLRGKLAALSPGPSDAVRQISATVASQPLMRSHELQESMEQPTRLRAQSGRRWAKASRPG